MTSDLQEGTFPESFESKEEIEVTVTGSNEVVEKDPYLLIGSL